MRKRLVLLQALAILTPSDDPLFKWRITHQKMKKGVVYEVPCKDCAGLHWGSGTLHACRRLTKHKVAGPQLEQQDSSPRLWPTAHVGSQPRSWHQLPTAGREGYERSSTSNQDINELGLWSVYKHSYCIKAISPLYHFSCCSLTVSSVPHGFHSM